MDLGDAYADKFMLITCLWFQVTLEEDMVKFWSDEDVEEDDVKESWEEEEEEILDASALAVVDASDFKETYYYSININFIASAAKIQVIKRGLFTTILKNDTIETVREKADLMPDVRKQDIRNFLPPVIFFFGFGTQTHKLNSTHIITGIQFFPHSCLATQQYHQG
ncbi:hypothetical protein ACJX0J_014786 [Zea mays]